MKHLQNRLATLSNNSFLTDKTEYESRLFRKGQIFSFEDPEGQKFPGVIMGVAPTGQLMLQLEDGQQTQYDFKMLRFVF